MKRKRLRKLIISVFLLAVLVMTLPAISVSASVEITPDEKVILSHLPDQQIGVKYPAGETINIGFL